MALSNDIIADLLLKDGVLSKNDVAAAKAESKKSGIPFSRILIAEGKVSQSYLNQLVSAYLHVPFADIHSKKLDLATIELIPESVARQRRVLVFEKNTAKHGYRVAFEDPTDVDNLNFIKEYLKGEIEPYLITPEDLRYGFQLYKKESSEKFEALIKAKIRELTSKIIKQDQSKILESVPIAEFFDTILDYAAILGASDVYFQPEEELLRIRFRVDGIVQDVVSMDGSVNEGLIARAKILASMRIDEHMKPQDGRFHFRSNELDMDVRAAVMPTIFGEKATLRLLSSREEFVSFEELGMGAGLAAKFQSALKKPFGMMLSSGPTGSGKTTTVYATLSLLNKPEVHITTIEDPVEYILPNISQTQVNPAAGVTFASGLRAFLRHNPDIMFVGEIRDPETADMAVNAALTGHLLISTIHTSDAPSTVTRLLDLGVPPFLLGATLNGIIAQRLVRKICLNCIQSDPASAEIAVKLLAAFPRLKEKIDVPKAMYKGAGCEVCNYSGYKGRVGIFELFEVTPAVRAFITSKKFDTEGLAVLAEKEGMVPMIMDGLAKVETGITTVAELLRVMNE